MPDRRRFALARSDAMTVTVDMMLVATLVVSVLSMILGVAGAAVVSRAGITGPLSLLGKRMAALAGGQLDVPVEGIERGDEVGAMAKAVQVFKEAGPAQRRLEAEAEAGRAAAEAQRSRQSAIDSARAEDLKAFAHQVEAGFELVSASGASLRGIVAQVAEMSDVVATIARSTKQQAVSLKKVSTAADQMDKVTQQNAAMVEEATAAAQALSHDTDALAQMIQRFRTKAPSAIVPAKGSMLPKRPQSAQPNAVAQMKPTGRGGAAPERRSEEQSWAEF